MSETNCTPLCLIAHTLYQEALNPIDFEALMRRPQNDHEDVELYPESMDTS